MIAHAEMSVEDFQKLLRDYAGSQTVARSALIAHLQKELATRGIRMSADTIEERFRRNTKVRTMPACVREVIKNLDGRFLTGLIPFEEMTGGEPAAVWLEKMRVAMGFRSDCAMHKALAEQTELNYESVHKALTGPHKAQRVQKKIADCFARWQQELAQGRRPVVQEVYFGTEAEKVREVLAELSRYYLSKEEMYNEVAELLGMKPSSVKRYHAARLQVKFVPTANYEKLMRHLETCRKTRVKRSYLKDEQRRTLAYGLFGQLSSVERRWRSEPQNDDLQAEYKSLRLRLIAAVKEGRDRQDLAAAYQ